MEKIVQDMEKIHAAIRDRKILPINSLQSFLIAKITPFLERRIKAEESAKPRKLLQKAYNSVSSLVDGIETGDVGSAEISDCLDDLQEITQQIKALHQASLDPKKTSKYKSEELLAANTLEAIDLAQQYGKYRNLLPRSIKGTFTALRMPVLVITYPHFNHDKLRSFSLSKNSYFQYPIIENQVVIGISGAALKQKYKMNWKKAFEEIVVSLKVKTGKTYEPAGSPRKYNDIFWLWVFDTQTHNKLVKSLAAGSHFKIKAWSFPFDPQDVKNEPTEHARVHKTLEVAMPAHVQDWIANTKEANRGIAVADLAQHVHLGTPVTKQVDLLYLSETDMPRSAPKGFAPNGRGGFTHIASGVEFLLRTAAHRDISRDTMAKMIRSSRNCGGQLVLSKFGLLMYLLGSDHSLESREVIKKLAEGVAETASTEMPQSYLQRLAAIIRS